MLEIHSTLDFRKMKGIFSYFKLKKSWSQEFPGGPVIWDCRRQCFDPTIPREGIKILHAVQSKGKKKKKTLKAALLITNKILKN